MSGLSRGLVGYHFRSKDQMLKETLAYLADEYRSGWEATLTDPDASPEERLLGLIDFDLGTVVCSRSRVAVWYAFWGSVRTKQLYRDVCLPADREYMKLIATQIKALKREEQIQGLDADGIATGYSAMTSDNGSNSISRLAVSIAKAPRGFAELIFVVSFLADSCGATPRELAVDH